LYEGFGLPLLEAMQFGVPIACSQSSSLPEIVGAAAAMFDPHSVDSIAATMRSVVNSAERRGALSQEGIERVKRFTPAEAAMQTLSVYDRIGAAS
jgi:glycosyltransferase involved in cell wall biosynthesis